MKRYLEIKPGSLSEIAIRLRDDYQAYFKKELEKTGKGIAQMTDAEKKAFFNRVDKEYNAKNEVMDSSWIKKEIDKERKTTLVAAPGNKEKVIRIPKEKLADYKKKGYVEAESYLPEATAKEGVTGAVAGGVLGGMAAGPIGAVAGAYLGHKVQKAAAKKKEEKEIEELTAGQKKLPPALQKAIKAKEKKEEVEITEGQYKEIDIRKGDLKLAKDKRQSLKDKYNAIMANQAQGDEDSIQDQIQKLDMSIKKQEQELIDIMKKGKEDQKNEAVDPERVQKLNQKIASMTTKIGELDKSKPENKTKEAIMKSDIATAKLRLQDLMQKSASEVKKAVNEASKAKQSYKSLKMSMKKEQEINGKKKTLTDKPITKVDVNPKIEG